ncbi:MAG: cell division protein FtsA [bacterium]
MFQNILSKMKNKMSREEIIVGLDIGSSAIRLVVGQKSQPEQPLKIIGAVETPSEGISRGVINGLEDAISSISACLEKAERLVGFPLEQAWVGISGSHIISEESKGVAIISKPNAEIQAEDVERAIEAARAVATPPNYEILHIVPRSFMVDGQSGIKDPIGMTGIRLEATAQIIMGLSAQVKNLTKCVYRTTLDINDLVLSILAAAEAALDSRQKNLGVVLINIGAFTTSLVVFEEGEILETAVLPVGSGHITNDIAIGLRIPLDIAEQIKLDYGHALAANFNKHDDLDLSEFSQGETGLVSRKYLAEIIAARVEEIFEGVDNELKRIGRAGKLPAGAVLIGGGAKLPGLIELAKKGLRLPAGLGQIVKLPTVADKADDLSFASALGLVLWGEQLQRRGGQFSSFSSVGKTVGDIKYWLKNLLS